MQKVLFCRSIFQSEHFPFLGTHTTRAYKDMRSRTTFYIALGRLLMVDLGEDDEKFESFMTPITSKGSFGYNSETVRVTDALSKPSSLKMLISFLLKKLRE